MTNKQKKKKYAAEFIVAGVSSLIGLGCIIYLIVGSMLNPPNKNLRSYEETESDTIREQNFEILQEAEEAYRNGADYWSSVESNYQPLDSDRVYWVPNGKSYHSTADCVALLKSSDIRHGSLKEAFELGKDDPCSKCVGD